MTVRNIKKNLAGAEDLLHGIGVETQSRGGAFYDMHKLDTYVPTYDVEEMKRSSLTFMRLYTSDTEYTDYRRNPTGTIGIPSDLGGVWEVIASSAKVRTFACVADMIADTSLVVGQIVETIGYYGDWVATATKPKGGNRYEIVAVGTSTNDGGSFITLSNGLQAKGLFVAGFVDACQFGAKGDGVTDNRQSIQKFADFISLSKKQTQVSPGTYGIAGTVSLSSNTEINGSTSGVEFKSLDSSIMFEAIGAYHGEGSVIANIKFKNCNFNGNSIGLQALDILGGYKFVLEECQMYGFTERYVYARQLFDSWVDKCVFNNTEGTDLTIPVIELNYGSTDNTNEIHWGDCLFENYNRPILKLSGGTGSANKINEIKFVSCKFESVYADTVHMLFDQANTITFIACNLASRTTDDASANNYMIQLSNCNQIHWIGGEVEWTGSRAYTFPMIYVSDSANNVSVVYASALNYLISSGLSMIHFATPDNSRIVNTYGTTINHNPVSRITNASNRNVITDGIEVLSKSTPTSRLTRDDGSIYRRYSGIIDSAGDYYLSTIIASVTYNLIRFDSANKAIKFPCGVDFSGTYSSQEKLSIGGYKFWMNGEAIRYTYGAPASSTSGRALGVKSASVPATSTSAGFPGLFAVDSNYLYVYTGDGTTHSWVRSVVSVW